MPEEETKWRTRVGRPESGNKRSRYYIYLTKDEEATVRTAAGDEDLSVWIRGIILKAAEMILRPQKPPSKKEQATAAKKKRPSIPKELKIPPIPSKRRPPPTF